MLRKFLFNVRVSFRMWMRNRTRPLTLEEAEEKTLFWSKIYMISGCVAFIFVSSTALMGTSNNFSNNLPIFTSVIDRMNDSSKIRVVKYSGFTKSSDVLMTKTDFYKMRNAKMQELKNDTEIN